MKLSSLEEMDDPPEESVGKQSASSGMQSESVGELRDETVSLMGDEMGVVEAVELLGEMLEQPEAFDLVTGAQYRSLQDRVGQLEEENERLAESLRAAYSIMDEAESIGQFSLEESVDDPREAFE